MNKVGLYSTLIAIIPFAYFCYQIANQKYPKIDERILLVVQRDKPAIFDVVLKAIYQASGTYVTGFIVLVVLTTLVYKHYWQEAKILALSTLGILLTVDEILKPFFDRRRPPKPRLVEDLSRYSFPSGHATGNLVFYCYLSFILASLYPESAKYIYTSAAIVILSIGFSCVYTNAHWLTDVLAGYVFGYLWLFLTFCLISWKNYGFKKSSKNKGESN